MYCAGRIGQSRRYSVFVNHNICTVLAESISPGDIVFLLIIIYVLCWQNRSVQEILCFC